MKRGKGREQGHGMLLCSSVTSSSTSGSCGGFWSAGTVLALLVLAFLVWTLVLDAELIRDLAALMYWVAGMTFVAVIVH